MEKSFYVCDVNKYHQPLLPEHTYHLFSRAIGSEKLFLCDENYRFFLQKLVQYTAPVCSIYCYALIPNHFHLLAKVKDEDILIQHFDEVKKKTYDPLQHNLSDFIMERFSNFLNSYTKSFNKVYRRKGSLFIDFMKRNCVVEENDFSTFVWYIHKNAVHHHLTKSVGQWKHDSYSLLLSDTQTFLLRNELFDWFGGRQEFIQFHQRLVYPKTPDLE